jgi:hypothetical protein
VTVRAFSPTARRAVLLAVAALGVASSQAWASDRSRVEQKLGTAAAPMGELRASDQVTLPGGATIHRYQQRVGGHPVLGAEAVVDDGPGAPPRLVADSTRAAIQTPPTARVARADAIAVATRNAGASALRGPVSARLAIQPGNGGQLVWRALVPAARPLGDFEILVDATSGEVVSQRNLLQRFQTGRAKIFKPNPIVEHGGTRGLHRDHRDRDTPLLRKLRRTVSLPNIREGQPCLRGRWIHALRGKKKRETCKGSLSWSRVTRSENRFEALMVYFHVNRAQAYIQSLGFSDSNEDPNGISDRVQRAVANAFKPDNSFYSPLTRTIKFGAGGVDDAEDADVIVHEYAHAMQASQSPAFAQSSGFSAGALAEGSSDYWAAVMSALTRNTVNEDDVCIFDWDAITYGRWFQRVAPSTSGRFCGRRADLQRTLAKARRGPSCGSDIHCVGQVWATALWSIRRAFVARYRGGGARMDQVYLASQFLYTGGERFRSAGKALLCADEDLNPKGAPGDCKGDGYPAIHRVLRDRGILN